MEQDNVQIADNNITAENTGTQPVKENEVKLFTQEQVDEIIKGRLKDERKKMPSKEELEAFHTWQEVLLSSPRDDYITRDSNGVLKEQ